MTESAHGLPLNVKREILDGVPYTHPRFCFQQARAAQALGMHIGSPFDIGWRGPGGWWILIEPWIALPDSPEVCPALAGWRRERMPEPPLDEAITIVPDWVCEIGALRTRQYHLVTKHRFYMKHGVTWLWIVEFDDRLLRTLVAYNGFWRDVGAGVWGYDDRVRAEPFEAIEFPITDLWLPADT